MAKQHFTKTFYTLVSPVKKHCVSTNKVILSLELSSSAEKTNQFHFSKLYIILCPLLEKHLVSWENI